MTIGERIRAARKAANNGKGLTQKQLGEKAGIAEPTIRRYELDKLHPKIETVQKIAKALNVSVGSLIGWSDDLAECIAEQHPTDLVTTDEHGNVRFYYYAPDVKITALEEDFNKLNEKGKIVALERVKELTLIADYRCPPATKE